jgi:hypothetical protein
LTMMFRVLTSSKFAYPKIKSSKNTRNSTHTQYIMKMRYNIISLFKKCELVLPQGLDSLFSKYLNWINFEYRV